MSPQLVVGLFPSSGIAEDARNRLRTEGVPGSQIALKVLTPAAPLHPTATPELEALSVNPLILGNVQETFARFVHNGETVVCVRAASDEQVEFAAEYFASVRSDSDQCPSFLLRIGTQIIQLQKKSDFNNTFEAEAGTLRRTRPLVFQY